MDQRKKPSEGYTTIPQQLNQRVLAGTTGPNEVLSSRYEPAIAPPSRSINKLDINRLRLAPSFGAKFGVTEVLNRVQIRKPGKDEFFKVHESNEWTFLTSIIELKREKEIYAVPPECRNLLPELTKTVLLRCAVTWNQEVILIPV
ncbi:MULTISPECIES: hypothetical protein [unclassified Duganella]|uniref:hypothetical protein n=1 Tax=unclassified Duganella TaxID=2636909 RepID=UPI000886BA0E|nr:MULTISPECIES: hypothetical protein [unclassified Duganella]SDG76938.1 hypothetical protein SAMN05216320_1071 [Duganella sp. OV458]SDK03860.1 hypothetical protein SAMN05428973_1081 [Duganella sp. OV510]